MSAQRGEPWKVQVINLGAPRLVKYDVCGAYCARDNTGAYACAGARAHHHLHVEESGIHHNS